MMQKRKYLLLIVLLVAVAFACSSNGMASDLSPPLSRLDKDCCNVVCNAFTATEQIPANPATGLSVYPTTATVNTVNIVTNPAITNQPALTTVIEENIAVATSPVLSSASGVYFQKLEIVNQAQTSVPPTCRGTEEVAHPTYIASDYSGLQQANWSVILNYTSETQTNVSSLSGTHYSGYVMTAANDLNGAVAMVLLKNSTTIVITDYPNPYYGIYNVTGLTNSMQTVTNRIDEEVNYPNPFNVISNGTMNCTAICGQGTQTPEVVLMTFSGETQIFGLTDGSGPPLQMLVMANDRTILDGAGAQTELTQNSGEGLECLAKTTGNDYPNPLRCV